MYLKHSTKDISVNCDICDSKHSNRKAMLLHKKLIHQKSATKCELCGEHFRQIQRHKLYFHKIGKDEDQWGKCDICGKMLFGNSALNRHKTNHFKEKVKNFSCKYELCDIKTDSLYNLNVHIATVHEQIRPFKCEKCDLTFKRKAHLQSHFNASHAIERHYKHYCDKCDFKSSCRRNFTNHTNAVHLGIRPYKCETCEKTFTQKTHYNTHIRNVHMSHKMFSCKYCDSEFSNRRDFERHHDSKRHKRKMKEIPEIPKQSKT